LAKKFADDNTAGFNITHFVGKAFVSFEYEHYREFLLRSYIKDKKSILLGDQAL
jgi:hypothetical protein